MKKEYAIVAAAGLFILAYVIDYLAGPVTITVKNPVMFLTDSVMTKYPFSALALTLRTLAMFISVLLTLSLTGPKYFTRAGLALFLAVLAELYAIQQLATGGRTTPVLWTLTFAYTGFLLAPSVIVFILMGILSAIKSAVNGPKNPNPPEPLNIESNKVAENKEEK